MLSFTSATSAARSVSARQAQRAARARDGSLWRRTMSLLNALNGVKVCNKAMSSLIASTGLPK
jgi:hypothetical protein